jgi:hypothetical protein
MNSQHDTPTHAANQPARPSEAKTGVAVELRARCFQRNGHFRVLNPRRRREGQACKKRCEARLPARNPAELNQICPCLRQAGFAHSKPCRHGSRIAVPINGKIHRPPFRPPVRSAPPAARAPQTVHWSSSS